MKEQDLILEVTATGTGLSMCIFYSGNENRLLRQIAVSDAEIDRLCVDIRNILEKKGISAEQQEKSIIELQKCGFSVFNTLFPPEIRDMLKTASATYLIICIDEKLMRIPWELVYDGTEFLCLSFSMSRNLGMLPKYYNIRRRSSNNPVKALILAPDSPAMGLTYYEGVGISGILFTEEGRLKTALKILDVDMEFVDKNIKNYDIVHFVGKISAGAANKWESGWVFKNGTLIPNRVKQLGSTRPFPSMIFSNTVQHEHGSSHGFVKAFLSSGVRHYIEMSWKIADEARLAFVKEFYKYLLREISVGEAVRLSRMKLVEIYGKESLFWAGYILYGDPALSIFDEEITPAMEKDKMKEQKRGRKPAIAAIYDTIKMPAILAVILMSVIGIIYFINSLSQLSASLEVGKDLARGVKHFAKIIESNEKEGARPIEQLEYPQAPVIEEKQVYTALLEDAKIIKQKKPNALITAKSSKLYDDILSLQNVVFSDLLLNLSLRVNIGPALEKKGEIRKIFKYFAKAKKYSTKGNYRLSLAYEEKALKLAEISNSSKALRNAYYNMGVMYIFSKNRDIKKSTAYLEKALKEQRSVNNRNDAAKIYLMLAYSYVGAKDYDRSLKYLDKGLKEAKFANDKRILGLLYKAYGDLFINKKEYYRAKEYYYKTLIMTDRLKALDSSLVYIDTLYKLAFLYLRMDDKSRAADYSKQIGNYSKKSPFTPYYEYFFKILRILVQ